MNIKDRSERPNLQKDTILGGALSGFCFLVVGFMVMCIIPSVYEIKIGRTLLSVLSLEVIVFIIFALVCTFILMKKKYFRAAIGFFSGAAMPIIAWLLCAWVTALVLRSQYGF